MKSRLAILILILSILSSCNKITHNSSINDIWVGDYTITYYYSDSIGHFDHDAPLLIDFTNDDTVFLKQRNGYKYSAIWKPQDSLLIIDSIEYKVLTVNNDSLVYFRSWEIDEKELNDYLLALDTANENDISIMADLPSKEYYVFKRIQDYRIYGPHSEISDLLNNKLFKRGNRNCTNYWLDEYFEFFDNGAVISRNIDNEQNEIYFQDYSWKVDNYKGYIFLIFYNDINQFNLIRDRGFQIVGISDNSFSILPKPSFSNIEYYVQKTKIDEPTGADITGTWRSNNDTVHYSKFLRRERRELHELVIDGILQYDFSNDSVDISFNDLDFFKYKWRWNSDYSLLIFEQEQEFNNYKYTYVDYLKIKTLKKDTLELELNDLFMHKHKGNVIHEIDLNQLQTFVKVSQ